MTQLTYDEQQMVAIYCAGSKAETIAALEEMQRVLGTDEPELHSLTNTTLQKLRSMSEEEFEDLDRIPDFGGDSDE